MAESLLFELQIDGSQSVKTLAELKTELSRLKGEFQNAEIGSKQFIELGESIKKVETAQKQLNQSFQQFKPGSVGAIKQELSDLNKALDSAVPGSREFDLILKQIGKNKGELKEIKENIRGLDDGIDNQIRQFSALAQSIAGGFTIATSAAALFGDENKDLQETILKVQSAMSLLQGIEALAGSKDAANIVRRILLFKSYNKEVQGGVVAQEGLNTVTKASALSMNGLKIAIASTGIGLLVVAVGELVANFDKVKAAIPNGILQRFGSIWVETKERAVGAVYAILGGLKAVGTLLKDVITLQFDKVIDDFKNVSKAFNEGFAEGIGVQRAREAAEQRKEVIEQEIKQLELKKERIAAAGNDTLAIEIQINEKRLSILEKGSDEYNTLEAQLAGQREKLRNDRSKKSIEVERKRLEDENKRKLELKKQYEDELQKQEKALQDREDINKDSFNLRIQSIENLYQNEINLLKKNTSDKLQQEILSKEQIEALNKQLADDLVEAEINKYLRIIQVKKSAGEDVLAEESRLNELLLQQSQEFASKKTESTKTNEQLELDAEKALVDKKKEIQQAYFEFISTLSNALKEKELRDINESKSKELAALDDKLKKKLITQEQYDKAKEKIEEQSAKKARKAERDAAVRQRVISLASIAINTAQAIIGALAPPPSGLGPVAGIPLATATGILGALQTGIVLAQPLPPLAKGGIVNVGGKSTDDVLGVSSTGQPTAMVNRGEAVITAGALSIPGVLPLLSAINVAGGGDKFAGFADDGVISDAISNQSPVVINNSNDELLNAILYRLDNPVAPIISEYEISSTQKNVSKIRERSTF